MKKILVFLILCSLISCKSSTETIEISNTNGIYYSLYGDIFKIDYDGSNKTQLTSGKYDNNNPKISSNGKFLLFETQGLKDITASGGLMYDFSIIKIMKIQTQKTDRVTDDTEDDWFPQFSPDNNAIIFSSMRTDNCDIYIMDVNGNQIKRLTNNNCWNVNPKFSPDGSKILFESQLNGNYNILIMDSDGTNQKQLTDSDWNIHPQFSPDGLQIIYESSQDIYLMNIDGSNKINLTNDEYGECTPRFSSDGQKIVFITVKVQGKNREVHIVDNNGKNRKTLITNKYAFEPQYFSNNNKILFSSKDDQYFYIYSVDSDGNNLKKMVQGGNPCVY